MGVSIPAARARIYSRVIGWSALGLVHVAVLALTLPESLHWSTRVSVLVLCAAQLLSVAVTLVAVGALTRIGAFTLGQRLHLAPSPRYLFLGIFAVLMVLAWILAREDFAGLAERHSATVPPSLTMASGAFVLATLLAGVVYAVQRCSGRLLRWLGVVCGLMLAVVSAAAVPAEYPGVVACVVVAAGLALATLPGRFGPVRSMCGAFGARRVWPLLVGVTVLGPGTLLAFEPDNATRLSLSGQPSALLTPLFHSIDVEVPPPGMVPIDQVQWFSDRSARESTPPTPSILPEDPLVLLIGVDALRADLLATDEHAERLPEMTRLRREGVWFTHARSPGASTVPALSAMFSGRYYSQLYWVVHPERPPGVYPHQDPSPRFTEELATAGVTTLTVDTAGWLLNEFGVVRGFSREWSARKKGYPRAGSVVSLLTRHLRGIEGSAFGFVHFLDAHAPYNSAGKAPTPFEGYLRELSVVDRALGRLRGFLADTGMEERTCIILFADHGESFGEHGHRFHAATLYDTLLRVPLIFHCPTLRARRVDTPVSLMDVGPTLMDLFGVPTPPHFIGESLSGFLRGETPELTRPILAEARLKQALITDGQKVIYDTRSGGVELYDLRADPDELRNLYDASDENSQKALARLRAFYEVHTHRAPGYQVPYRKW